MISDWAVPFHLTSQLYSADLLDFNVAIPGLGTYYLRPDGCSLTNTVRAGKENVPQDDGAIFHRRFVAGMEMTLAIQLWADEDKYACKAQVQEMTDTLMGYLYNLINAGDNEGRISWEPWGVNARMLDDLRLWTYPIEELVAENAGVEIQVTLDCELPYEEDLLQLSPALPGVLVNGGNRGTFPVYIIEGPFSVFTLENTTTGDIIGYNAAQPGAVPVGGGDYIEINTFKNTAFLNGDGADLLPGIVYAYSDFKELPMGASTFTLIGDATTGHALVNAAWA